MILQVLFLKPNPNSVIWIYPPSTLWNTCFFPVPKTGRLSASSSSQGALQGVADGGGVAGRVAAAPQGQSDLEVEPRNQGRMLFQSSIFKCLHPRKLT